MAIFWLWFANLYLAFFLLLREREPYEVNSGEDMLARVHECNKNTQARIDDWLRRRLAKIWTDCESCEDRASLVLGCDNCHPIYKEQITSASQNEYSKNSFCDMAADCKECGPRISARIAHSCSTCGPGVNKKELERCLLGNDVVGLFPNIKSKNTGRIVREKVEKSGVRFKGFDYKH